MIDLKKLSLTIGIMVVFAFLVFSIIDLVYEEPQYEDFCGRERFEAKPFPVREPANCTPLYLGNMTDECYDNKGQINYDYDSYGCAVSAECDYCQKEYDEASERYNMNLFYIAAPIGLIALVLGMYLPLTVEAIASGFMFGGIAVLFVSTARVFGDLSKLGRVITLLVELVLIIWLGYRKVSDIKPKKKKKK